jgi:hypothetical protein
MNQLIKQTKKTLNRQAVSRLGRATAMNFLDGQFTKKITKLNKKIIDRVQKFQPSQSFLALRIS